MNSTLDSKRIRVALLGAGAISEPHIEALENIEAPKSIEALKTLSGQAEVVGICDRDEPKARALVEQYGVGKSFGNLDIMLESAYPDVVHILLPPAHAGDLRWEVPV